MGVVLCKKHGKTGIVLTCNHLSELVWNFQPIDDFVKRIEKDTDDIDDKFKFDWIYTLCRTCDKKYQTATIGEFPAYFLKSACNRCFLELSDLKSWN